MADDRMRNNDDLDRNMGGAGQKDQDKYSQKTPGHGQQQDDASMGQRGAGQRGEQGHMKDEFGGSGKSGGAGQGGQNRPNR